LDISCVVLAGGKGLRLGHSKTLEVIGNKSLLQRVISGLSPFGGDIIVVSAAEQPLSPMVSHPGVKTVTDIHRDKGPLAGIYAGLAASDSFYNLVVACDMPFLNPALLSYMMQAASGFDLVIPRMGELVEPLHAVYAKSCLGPMAGLLNQDRLKVSHLLRLVRVRYVEAAEIDRFDPEHLSFFNINTAADLKRARELTERREK
jgi:molybdopterin-guanine dinucleotide biosynthesis protein A